MAWVPLLPIPIQLQDGTTSVNMASGSLEFYEAGTSTPTNLASDNTGTSIGSSITLNSAGYPESGGNVITLFRDTTVNLKVVGKNAAGTTIWTADNLKDALVILSSTSNGEGASLVSIEDSGGYFTATTVEGALADIGQDYLKDNRNHTLSATYTWSGGGGLVLGDRVIQGANLTDISWVYSSTASSSGTLTLDYSFSNTWLVTLTENISTWNITNPPASGNTGQIVVEFVQDGGGGAYTVALPSGSLTPGGSGWTMSTANDAIDRVQLVTRDGGTTWYVDFSQAYA